MLAFIYVPIIQKELDIFRTTVWNHKRGRKQPGKELPTGIPEHIYENPEEYDGENYGVAIDDNDLVEIAENTGILDNIDEFLERELMDEFGQHIDTSTVEPQDAAEAYINLKQLCP